MPDIKWEVQGLPSEPNAVCYSLMIGGVLCCWWGDEAPEGAAPLLAFARQYKAIRTLIRHEYCKFCGLGSEPDRRFGYWWHWDDSIKALVSCAQRNGRQLEDEIRGQK